MIAIAYTEFLDNGAYQVNGKLAFEKYFLIVKQNEITKVKCHVNVIYDARIDYRIMRSIVIGFYPFCSILVCLSITFEGKTHSKQIKTQKVTEKNDTHTHKTSQLNWQIWIGWSFFFWLLLLFGLVLVDLLIGKINTHPILFDWFTFCTTRIGCELVWFVWLKVCKSCLEW